MNFSAKYTTLLLIILLCAFLAGCGTDSETPADKTQPPEQNQTAPPENDETDDDLTTDSGTFTGRIDDLSIEIQISGVPEDNGYRAFELSEQLRRDFDSYGFNTGDQVIFKYEPGTDGRRGVIMEIELIKNQ